MRTSWNRVACVVVLGFSIATAAPPRDGVLPSASQSPIGTPQIFAPHVISTPDDEFGGAFSPDGQTVVFDKTVLRHYLYVICESHLSNGRWTTPTIVPFSGVYRDSDPVFSPDGTKLYFVSDRPVEGKPKTDFDIWFVRRTRRGWAAPEHLAAPVNGNSGEYFASEASNGDLFFSSDRAGGKGGLDVYRSKLVGGVYSEPENLGDAINSDAWELDCLVAPDESFLLIGSIGRPDSYGNYDLYVSFNRGGVWSPAEHLGPSINTSAREYSPRLSPDGRTLTFTSEKDFTMEPRSKPMTSEVFERGLAGLFNGSGNIYRVDLASAFEGTTGGGR